MIYRAGINIFAVLFILFAPGVLSAANKSGVEPQVISLPKGPGSIEGLGESFEPQLNTGTATYRVKIAVSPGVNKHQPEVALEYNSGYGNSTVGIGWDLNTPYIQRRTDKGLPTYADNDRFTYSRNGEIVPLADGSYRLKVEGLFVRFEKVGDKWEAWEKDGTKLSFGEDAAARQSTPLGTFRWYLQKSVDVNGNRISYLYAPDRGQVYLSEIRYSSISDTVFKSVVFFYEARPDVSSDYHSRSLVMTAQRLKNIEVRSDGQVVREYQFDYQQGMDFSFLSQVTTIGSDAVNTLPPFSFSYSTYIPENFKIVTMVNAPPAGVSLTSPNVDLIDIDGDSLPDIINTESGRHKFFINKGKGVWDRVPSIPDYSPPHLLASNGVMMADIDGDGLSDLFVSDNYYFGYFKNIGNLTWEKIDCKPVNSFSFESRNMRMLDLNNDGLIDVLIDNGTSYLAWINSSVGPNQWGNHLTKNLPDSSHLSFYDPSVKLGDMNGDRMEDLVSIVSGIVSYFPSKGNGDFDHKITMSTPIGLHLESISKISLVDINNDGFSDLVVVDNARIKVWFNSGKNSFKRPVEFTGTPQVIGGTSAYRFADMNGDGFRDLLITSENAASSYQYVDFTNGAHPNLLTTISNGLGQETTISYQSSTEDYLADRDAGTPWTTKLPFPVQVVKSVAVKELNSGQEYVTDYHYRDGYYDGVEKEFRGFGGVTKLERGDAAAPTFKTVYTFDTGKEEISRKGMVKQVAALTETGTVTPPVGLFDQEENTLETRTLFSGTNGEKVSFSFIKGKNVRVFENSAAYTLLSREYDQDNYGNTTKEFNYGIVLGTDKGAGKDELLTTTTYNYDVVNWVHDRPDTVSNTDLSGKFVSLQKNYYSYPADSRWNLIRQESSPDGSTFISVVRNEYDSYGNIVKITDANDHWRKIDYDSLFHTFPVGETIGGLNLSLSAGYDTGLGVVTSFTDFNRNVTTFGYDTFGRLKQIVKPGDSATLPTQQFDYLLKSPVSSISTKSREVSGGTGTYDSVAYFDGLGRKLQTRSEGTGGKWVVADAVVFNQRKGIARKWLPYFADSSAYVATDTAQSFTSFGYDAKGRSVKETNPDASFRSTLYQPLTKVISDEEDNNPTSPHAGTPHTFVTDGLERLVEVRERNGLTATYTTRYEYDGLNSLTKITDAEGNVKTMAFDGLGRKTTMYDPDKHAMSYLYDPAGNLLSTTDARKQTVSYGYDAANRILTESFNGVKVRYHYDADLPAAWPWLTNSKGKLTWVEDEAGKEAYSYDGRGNTVAKLRETTGLAFLNRMSYDAMDRLTSLTYPDGYQVSYNYNSMNLLDSVPGFVNGIDYTPTSQKNRFAYANGMASNYGYDLRQRLSNLKSTVPGRVLQDLTYKYDTVSNITSTTDSRPTKSTEELSRTYGYDDLYRLTGAVAAAWTETYQYSSIGNMTFKSDIGNMSYGANGAGPHALTNAAGANLNYSYDANGNISAKTPGYTYQFDHKDRLASARRTADAADIRYTYDAKGNRVTKSVSVGTATATTLYADKFTELRGDRLIKQIFAGDRLVARINSPFDSGRLTARKTLTIADFDQSPKDDVISLQEIRQQGYDLSKLEGADVADALRIYQANRETVPGLLPFGTMAQVFHELGEWSVLGESVAFYLPDHLGSASIVTDVTGQVVEESVYYPYGKDRARTGPYRSEYRFTGKELDDETGLHYFGARYYDSVTGRFVSVDPWLHDATIDKINRYTPKTLLNPYGYADHSPVKYIDPNGKFRLDTLGYAAMNLGKMSADVASSAVKGFSAPLVGAAVAVGTFAATATTAILTNDGDLAAKSLLYSAAAGSAATASVATSAFSSYNSAVKDAKAAGANIANSILNKDPEYINNQKGLYKDNAYMDMNDAVADVLCLPISFVDIGLLGSSTGAITKATKYYDLYSSGANLYDTVKNKDDRVFEEKVLDRIRK